MKRVVVYESQTGSTKQYAEWIARQIDAQLIALNECTASILQQADLIVFGGSVHGGSINGKRKFSKIAKKATANNLIYFGVGIRPSTPRTLELIRNSNFDSNSDVPLFYFRGKFDPDALNQSDKTMIRIYQSMLKRRRDIHQEDVELLDTMRYPCDFISEEQIDPLVQEIRNRI